MRKIGVYLADTHGGHKLGLLNPKTELYEEDQHEGRGYWYCPELTETQRYLWSVYTSHREEVWEFAGGAATHVFHCGDECHGDKYPDQLVSTRMGDQLLIGEGNLKPWIKEGCRSLRLEKGTSAHDFGESSSTMVITRHLRDQFPDCNVDMVKHGVANFDGCRIDYAHHGPHPGIRVWTQGNQLRYYVKDRMLSSILHGEDPPQVFIRAHYHTAMHEVVEVRGHKTWRCEAYILPSYCGLSDFGAQATRSMDRVDVGMLAFAIEDGELADTLELVETLDLKMEEEF